LKAEKFESETSSVSGDMNVVLSCWVNSVKCLKCRPLSGLSCAAERCGSGGSDPAVRVAAHERLGEVLRILRIILERYPALQSTELLVAAGSLIHQVKGKQTDKYLTLFHSFIRSIPLCVRVLHPKQNTPTTMSATTSRNSWNRLISWPWPSAAGKIFEKSQPLHLLSRDGEIRPPDGSRCVLRLWFWSGVDRTENSDANRR
jgi:hypothetical protein